ncbi:MAG: hypothetical protein JRF15_12515 [Deltaproteobacteria bacterium]|nr:hypothetical protein [Deltaproteobacteria bacterium]
MTDSKPSGLTKESAFRIFKITIFWILMANLLYYLYEDVTAYLYVEQPSLFDTLEAFAVSIDYIAWMVLIVLFELETNAQSKDRFTGARKWVITGLTAACYVVLVYAAYGYAAGLVNTYNFEPLEDNTACYFANTNFAFMTDSARPVELTDKNCRDLEAEKLFKSPTDHVLATESVLPALIRLGWVDIFNSNAWLLVVLLFQIELSLEQAKMLTKRRLKIIMVWKGFAYLVLLLCAIYWTIFSSFIDWWDAWLWLVAFILIDLNMLGLDETQNQQAANRAAAAEAN